MLLTILLSICGSVFRLRQSLRCDVLIDYTECVRKSILITLVRSVEKVILHVLQFLENSYHVIFQ